VNLTRVLLDANRPSDALPVAKHAVEVSPDSGAAHRVLGRVWHTLGSTVEALVAYGRATEIDSTDAWAWNNAGLLLIEGERFDEAVRELANACQHGAEAVFFNNYGVALERTGRYGEAAEAYARAAGDGNGSEKARLSLARVQPLVGTETPAPVLASTSGARELEEVGSSGE
jgi:Tfp pilus assembly protein PilF